MKLFILLVSVLAVSALDIDWSAYKPIAEYPEFWASKDLTPPAINPVDRVGRIVGGSQALRNQFPYQAAVLMNFPQGGILCGGAIISERIVVTAAHCVDQAQSGVIIVGGWDRTNAAEPGQIRQTVAREDIRFHENWTPSLIRNDVAIVRLPEAVAQNQNIQFLRLPQGAELNEDFTGVMSTVSGWGLTSDGGTTAAILRFVNVPVISQLACTLRFPGINQPSNICTSGDGGRSSCSGDSGGPLTVQRGAGSLLVGIVSFGRASGCEQGFPAAYARATFFTNWFLTNSASMLA